MTGIYPMKHIRRVSSPVWSALADPRRRAVLDLLRGAPQSVGELSRAVGLSQPSTSKHLRVLREAGLVEARVVAQQRVYQLDPAPLADLDAWLSPYRRRWSASLDTLARRLDEQAPTSEETPG